MRNIIVTVGPLAAASANAIALSQTPTAGALTLNGALATNGVAKTDMPRRVLITTTANESSNTFTITGTNWSGNPISETIIGPNAGTAQSVLDYATITRITISGNASGALTVGTSGVASSAWIVLDRYASPETAVQAIVTGTANYTIQCTLDEATQNNPPSAINWFSSPDSQVVNATANQLSSFYPSPNYVRVTLNSGTGSVKCNFMQSGVVPY